MVVDRESTLTMLCMCKSISAMTRGKNLPILLSLPRHTLNPCCSDATHCTNRAKVT